MITLGGPKMKHCYQTYIYSMSYRHDVNMNSCPKCNTNDVTIIEKSYQQGGIETYIQRLKCNKCGYQEHE